MNANSGEEFHSYDLKYLRNVSVAVRFIYSYSQLLEASRFGHFRFAISAKRLDGSKCRDCDTRQTIC